jgi:hypothetical protein
MWIESAAMNCCLGRMFAKPPLRQAQDRTAFGKLRADWQAAGQAFGVVELLL